MNRTAALLLVVIVLLLALCGFLWFSLMQSEATAEEISSGSEFQEEAELAAYMNNLQRWSHKLLLSAQAENEEVSEFYLHELEEQVEEIQADVPEYEGYAIADLTETILVPQLDSLHTAMEGNSWATIHERLDGVIQACNQCHEATDHGFIQITADPGPNPYNQRFDVP